VSVSVSVSPPSPVSFQDDLPDLVPIPVSREEVAVVTAATPPQTPPPPPPPPQKRAPRWRLPTRTRIDSRPRARARAAAKTQPGFGSQL
jgi:hypothetical protein